MEFKWHRGVWEEIFNRQVTLIQEDVMRALASDRLVVYLSCPVSSRGGSLSTTNIDIALSTTRRLSSEWGDRFWFLNPAQYQLESPHGTGLLARHASYIQVDGKPLDWKALLKKSPPSGGDYMRMWTRVLAEDADQNQGERFAAIYFVGPADCRHFFTAGGKGSLSNGVEAYFARKYATDREFNAYFSEPFFDAENEPVSDPVAEWDRRRKEFLRYYTVRAGAAFSRGSHDEWNIWVALNQLRLSRSNDGVGTQIPGFFEGAQVDPASAKTSIESGYAVSSESDGKPSTPLRTVPLPSQSTETTSRAHAQQSLAGLPRTGRG
jgi:hypothetical protein